MTSSLLNLGFTSIDDKVVLLSGASSGIGRATARLLARFGARVAVMARSGSKLESLAAEVIGDGHPPLLVIRGDVQEETDCIRAVGECVRFFGRIDVLINNAAIGFPVAIESCSTADFRRTMATNLDGVFFLTRAVLPVMRAQRTGHIIMISSDAGAQGSGVAPIYSTSKHALEGFTASLREQLDSMHAAHVHIRLTNIWPGTIDSDYWGTRDVPRHTFMSCAEMACFVVQVVACQACANVEEIRVRQFRFDAPEEDTAGTRIERPGR